MPSSRLTYFNSPSAPDSFNKRWSNLHGAFPLDFFCDPWPPWALPSPWGSEGVDLETPSFRGGRGYGSTFGGRISDGSDAETLLLFDIAGIASAPSFSVSATLRGLAGLSATRCIWCAASWALISSSFTSQESKKKSSCCEMFRRPPARSPSVSRQLKSSCTSPFHFSLLQARRSSGYDKLPEPSWSKCLNISWTDPKCFMAQALKDMRIKAESSSNSSNEIRPERSVSKALQAPPRLPLNFNFSQASLNSSHETLLESSLSKRDRHAESGCAYFFLTSFCSSDKASSSGSA